MATWLRSRYPRRLSPDWVRLMRESPFKAPTPHSRKLKLGLKYEAFVKDKLEEEFGLFFIPGQWYE